MSADTTDLIERALDYDPDTGVFRWKVDMSPRSMAGSVAGRINNRGYRIIRIKGNHYRAHRLAFLLMTGDFPTLDMDHINHSKDDNRWLNLREVSKQRNAQNLPMSSNNISGITGVYWHKKNQRWIAGIGIYGRKLHLGSYADKSKAAAARKAAENKYGFHANHGR